VHGPQGHTDYRAYKPWLRDEFEFRCVYCLTRERWSDFGHTIFSADHVKPKSRFGELATEYDNLVYSCMRCNGLKAAQGGLPDPCKDSLARHLKHRSGMFFPRTPQGKRLVAYLKLNECQRVDSRQSTLLMFDAQARRSRKELALKFSYPTDLPDLTAQRPPKGNRRPAGLQQSHHARKQAKKLPDYY
jgi:hypothetical protein